MHAYTCFLGLLLLLVPPGQSIRLEPAGGSKDFSIPNARLQFKMDKLWASVPNAFATADEEYQMFTCNEKYENTVTMTTYSEAGCSNKTFTRSTTISVFSFTEETQMPRMHTFGECGAASGNSISLICRDKALVIQVWLNEANCKGVPYGERYGVCQSGDSDSDSDVEQWDSVYCSATFADSVTFSNFESNDCSTPPTEARILTWKKFQETLPAGEEFVHPAGECFSWNYGTHYFAKWICDRGEPLQLNFYADPLCRTIIGNNTWVCLKENEDSDSDESFALI